MFKFDTQIKYNFSPKQTESSINNKSNTNSVDNSPKEKSVNTIKIQIPKLPKIKNIVSINFPLIKRLPQQTEVSSNFNSLKILKKEKTPLKSVISRKEIIQKILFKNKKYSISKNNNFNYDNENSTIDNDYYNITKALQKERCKSNIDVKNKNAKNSINCITIENQRLFKKNDLRNNYNNYKSDIHNISDRSMRKTKNSSFKNKECFSVDRSKKIINPKNFLDGENYLNSDFISQFTKRKKPYCKDISFEKIKERLFKCNIKKIKKNDNNINNNKEYLIKINSELPLMKVGSRYNEPDSQILKDEIQENFEERLKNFYEIENMKSIKKNRKIIDLSLKTREEITKIFKDKKLRKCNYLIGKNRRSINEIRDKINKDYNKLISSFHEYDDWNSPENEDNLYDK